MATGQINRIRASFRALDLQTKESEKMFTKSLKTLGAGVITTAAGVGVLTGAFQAAKKAGEFDEVINRFKVMSGNANDAAFAAKATSKALEVASNREFTPTEIAQGFVALNQAGLDTKDTFEAIGATSLFASASGGKVGVDMAAKFTGGLVKSGVATENLSAKLDQMAGFTKNFAIEFNELPRVLGNVIGPANITGQEMSEVLTVLGNSGTVMQDFSKASTGLRNVLTRMVNKDKSEKLFKAIGVSTLDATGNVKSMKQMMIELNDAFEKMGKEELGTALAKEFGERGGSLTLLSAIEGLRNEAKKGGVSFAEAFQQGVEANRFGKHTGLLEQLRTETLDKTLTGQMKLLRGKFESFVIAIGKPLAKALLPIVQSVGVALDRMSSFFQSLSPDTQEFIGKIILLGGTALTAAGAVTILVAGFQLMSLALAPIGATLAGLAGLLTPILLIGTSVFALINNNGPGVQRIATFFSDLGLAIMGLVDAMDGEMKPATIEMLRNNERATKMLVWLRTTFIKVKTAVIQFTRGFTEGIKPLIKTADALLNVGLELLSWVGWVANGMLGFASDTNDATGAAEKLGKVVAFGVRIFVIYKAWTLAAAAAQAIFKGAQIAATVATTGMNTALGAQAGLLRANKAGMLGAVVAAGALGVMVGRQADKWFKLSDTIAGVNKGIKTFRGLTSTDHKFISKDANLSDQREAARTARAINESNTKLKTLRSEQDSSTIVGEALFGRSKYGQRLGLAGALFERRQRDQQIAEEEARLQGLMAREKSLAAKGVLTNDASAGFGVESGTAKALREGRNVITEEEGLRNDQILREERAKDRKAMAEAVSNAISGLVLNVDGQTLGRAADKGIAEYRQSASQPLGSNPEDT